MHLASATFFPASVTWGLLEPAGHSGSSVSLSPAPPTGQGGPSLNLSFPHRPHCPACPPGEPGRMTLTWKHWGCRWWVGGGLGTRFLLRSSRTGQMLLIPEVTLAASFLLFPPWFPIYEGREGVGVGWGGLGKGGGQQMPKPLGGPSRVSGSLVSGRSPIPPPPESPSRPRCLASPSPGRCRAVNVSGSSPGTRKAHYLKVEGSVRWGRGEEHWLCPPGPFSPRPWGNCPENPRP